MKERLVVSDKETMELFAKNPTLKQIFEPIKIYYLSIKNDFRRKRLATHTIAKFGKWSIW